MFILNTGILADKFIIDILL